MPQDKTLISIGDFIDLFYKIRQKGHSALSPVIRLSGKARVRSKWNTFDSSTDFWVIPEVRKRWNEKCTGHPDLEYEDYVVSKYLTGATELRMLSVGCGSGSRERKFARFANFKLIEGIDMASRQVDEARKYASELGLNNIRCIVGDFKTIELQAGTYDVILFNSSLHHFDNIDNLLKNKVMPLLKKDGYLIIFEFVGPSRLQWTREQLVLANALLQELPSQYRIRFQSTALKNRIYRPGLLRMLLVDPSEAIDSESIIPSIHKHFRIMEEKKVGWDILHILLKDISHNFLGKDTDTQKWLNYLFEKEDAYLSKTGNSDAVFGVYQNNIQ
jgi:ubiquinone/menaquinone biosynthesis C-methylase UbiE